MSSLSQERQDRASGAIVGTAVGDALGAPYEFGALRPGVRLSGTVADMAGSHQWRAGEWTDDTAMAVPILQQVAKGADLSSDAAQDVIVAAWVDWAQTAKDVGLQTSAVLHGLSSPTAQAARASARGVHDAHGRSAGNGSVMRTAPVALAYLDSPDGLERVARAADAIAALTHYEADAREGAVLWSTMIHLAVRDGVADLTRALAVVQAERREHWERVLRDAEGADPDSFSHNGWVVHAMQAAWAALWAGGLRTSDPTTFTPQAFIGTMNAAIDIHNDTDTVAAIAGGLAGALVGLRSIPRGWLESVQGWPGYTAKDLINLAAHSPAHTPRR